MDIPWPVSLGIGGGSIVALLSFLTWFLRQLARGYDPEGQKQGLVPGSAVAQLIAAEREKGAAIVGLYAEQAAEKDETIRVERDGRKAVETAATRLTESLGLLDDFLTKTPKRVIDQ